MSVSERSRRRGIVDADRFQTALKSPWLLADLPGCNADGEGENDRGLTGNGH